MILTHWKNILPVLPEFPFWPKICKFFSSDVFSFAGNEESESFYIVLELKIAKIRAIFKLKVGITQHKVYILV